SRDHLPLPVHGAARALQRGREIQQRARAAREYYLERRRGLESRADHPEYGPTHFAGGVRRRFETVARTFEKVGGRTNPLGRTDWPARRYRRKNRRNGR